MQTLIMNACIHSANGIINDQVLLIENGKISNNKINPDAKIIDLNNKHLAPGFIDTHINGGEQFYFTQHPNESTIQDIYESSLRLGTTHVLPTLITSPLENILKGIEATKNFMQKNPHSGVLGMHLEGPFLNLSKRGLIWQNTYKSQPEPCLKK